MCIGRGEKLRRSGSLFAFHEKASNRRFYSTPMKTERPQALPPFFTQAIDPSRIALNPDCGFAPDYGEPPSIDEAYEKLCHLSEAAARLRRRFAD